MSPPFRWQNHQIDRLTQQMGAGVVAADDEGGGIVTHRAASG
jgi:hypothetical protein